LVNTNGKNSLQCASSKRTKAIINSRIRNSKKGTTALNSGARSYYVSG
jgi:hypothetical protein